METKVISSTNNDDIVSWLLKMMSIDSKDMKDKNVLKWEE